MADSTDESQSKDQNRHGDQSDIDEGFEEQFGDYEDDEHLYDDWDELATDPEEVSRLGKALEGLMPDVVKRGLDGLISEDRIRSLARQKELPREVVGFILGQVDSTKREVLRVVSREVRMFLQNVDLGGELTKILTSVSFEIRTEVRFIPNDAAFQPEVKNKVSVRGKDGEKKTISDTEAEEPEQTEDDEQDSRESEAPRSRRWGFRRQEDDDEDEGEEQQREDQGEEA